MSARLLRRPVKVHGETRRDDQIARDNADALLVQLAREHDGMFVVKRRVASRDYKIARNRAGRGVKCPRRPDGGCKAVVNAECFERGERSSKLDGRGWI